MKINLFTVWFEVLEVHNVIFVSLRFVFIVNFLKMKNKEAAGTVSVTDSCSSYNSNFYPSKRYIRIEKNVICTQMFILQNDSATTRCLLCLFCKKPPATKVTLDKSFLCLTGNFQLNGKQNNVRTKNLVTNSFLQMLNNIPKSKSPQPKANIIIINANK